MENLTKNKILNIFIIAIFVLAVAFFVRFGLGGPEDTWICQNGQWIKHGNPQNGIPNETCGEAPKMQVQLFFNNNNFGSGFECQKVSGVRTEIIESDSPEIETLKLMLAGPTNEQKERGYFPSIKEGTRLLGLVIENGLAIVNFNQNPWDLTDSSCRPLGARAQIVETLKQFSGVSEVQILANGKKLI